MNLKIVNAKLWLVDGARVPYEGWKTIGTPTLSIVRGIPVYHVEEKWLRLSMNDSSWVNDTYIKDV